MSWDSELDLVKALKPVIVDDKRVVEFEKSLKEKQLARPWHSGLSSRLADRACVIFKDITADMIKSQMVALDSRYSNQIFTLSECEHGFMKNLNTWWEDAPQGLDQRNFITFSAECLQWPETDKLLQQVLEKRNQLSWTYS